MSCALSAFNLFMKTLFLACLNKTRYLLASAVRAEARRAVPGTSGRPMPHRGGHRSEVQEDGCLIERPIHFLRKVWALHNGNGAVSRLRPALLLIERTSG